MSSVQEGTLVQNHLKSVPSSSVGIASSGYPSTSFNILNNLATINGNIGQAPKLVPTIATSGFSTSSRPGQFHHNNEGNNSSSASDNIGRNNLVNVHLQQAPPILIPSTNASMTSSLPLQPVVAAPVVPPAPTNTSCPVQTSPATSIIVTGTSLL